MRYFQIILRTAVFLLMLVVTACFPKSEPVISEGPPLPTTSIETAGPAATEETVEPAATEESVEPQFPDFDASNFDNSNSIVINNKWSPMLPGTFWAYEGSALDGGETISRRIEFTVTDLTKEIDGVRTVVAWIEDYNNDELIEKEVSFYAQDKDSNVWYFGEHPEDYEAGEFM